MCRDLDQIDERAARPARNEDLALSPAAQVFRSLIESVIVHPVPARARLDIEIRGYLAQLTKDPGFVPMRRLYGVAVVAEEGLEPPTQGL